MKKHQWVGVVFLVLTCIMLSASQTKADCTWSVSGTVKVQTQEPLLSSKFGAQIPLKGIKVKISGATVSGIFDSWGEVNTDAKGNFSLSKQKSCGDRELKIEVRFQNDNVEIRDDKLGGIIPNVPWYTIVQDSEKRRKAGPIQIVPTVFAAGKNNDLNDTVARHHAARSSGGLWFAVQVYRAKHYQVSEQRSYCRRQQ